MKLSLSYFGMSIALSAFVLLIYSVREAEAAPVGAIVVMTPPAVRSSPDAGTCYTISNPDARNYCLAKARHEPSQCYAIQRNDLRSLCLSETRQ
jgi:hypothetical protein